MLDGFEEFLFQSFLFAFRVMFKLIWAVLRPVLPDLVSGALTLLCFPVTWAVVLVAALWVLTDHGIAASIIAVAAIIASFVTAFLRPGLR